MTKPSLLVLAAGMGSRYGGLKQLEPVGSDGRTIMDYSIDDALRAGFGRVVFVIRRDFEESFKKSVVARLEPKVPIACVFQELDSLPAGFCMPPNRKKPWGTGHAILMAGDAIDGPFAAINADDLYGANSFIALAEHLRSGTADDAMVGFRLRNTLSRFGTVGRGVCRIESDGYLQSVTELTNIERVGDGVKALAPDGKTIQLTGDETVSMNMWGFTPAIFGQLRGLFIEFLKEHGMDEKTEFYIPAAINDIVRARRARVKVLSTPDTWFGVTYPQDTPSVIEALRQLARDAKG